MFKVVYNSTRSHNHIYYLSTNYNYVFCLYQLQCVEDINKLIKSYIEPYVISNIMRDVPHMFKRMGSHNNKPKFI